VIDYLQANYADPKLCSDEVAFACGISRRQLYREFLVGESFAELLRRVRIEHATNRIAGSPHVPLGQVALDCGFFSAGTFAHSFRALHGCTPREYRASSGTRRG
jgi:AraC-like DNA-binding protein